MSQHLILVTNIPNPYRLHSFAMLQRELDSRGIALDVLFMAFTETGRLWVPQPETWPFKGRILGGIHPHWRGIDMHINPGIWSSVLKQAPTWLIIGGGWQFPTSLGLFLLRPFYKGRTHSLVWSEANYHFSAHLTGPIAHVRRRLLTSTDGLVIPGQIAAETVTAHWHLPESQLVYWPNLVDETLYHKQVAALRLERAALRVRYAIPKANRVLFWSARLEEHTKGILSFLQPAARVLTPNVTILLAGDGPDHASIEQWIMDHDHLDIRLLGHISQDQMLECLSLADVFILPSLRDSNPLSVIEALWAGLPILTSTKCGNWPETVQVGQNGWLIDPTQPDEIENAVQNILTFTPEHLQAMGQKSLELAQANFASQTATQRFVDSLIATFPPRA